MLEKWKEVEKQHFDDIDFFIKKNKLLSAEMKREYEHNTLGFNVFQIVSDTYYKENFHSYLIYNLLSESYHEEGNLFMLEFLKCLNLISNNIINLNDFNNPVVEREKDNIDIRIRDYSSKKSIIIENKMNGAIDQPDQIPRYYKNEIDAEFEVEGIVYLTLTTGKKPDKKNWSKNYGKYLQEIDERLIYLSASKNRKINLLSNWIDSCINISNHIDVISTLRQYKAIIQHLREKEMNQKLVQKFYTQIKDGENYSTALSIRSMLEELNEFRALNLKNKFQYKAIGVFKSISHFPYKKEFRAKFEDPTFKNIDFWIDVVCVENETKVYFHETTKTFVENIDKIKNLLERLNEIDNFNKAAPYSYIRFFRFPEEEKDLFQFLETVFEQLKRMKNINF